MKTIQELRATFPRAGRLEWIGLREARRAPVLSVPEAEVHPLVGLIGDHGKTAPPRLRALTGEPGEVPTPSEATPVPGGPGRRQVTLLQAEHLPVIAALAGLEEVRPEHLRRNLLIGGLSLLALKDARFRVGEVVLEGTGECHPCSRMEETLGEGGYNAVRGHGGLTARVISGGVIRVGDPVEFLEPGTAG
ncbi:MOSC domain-containing protein [Deinococcus metallilatus]|uniref:MOSC domain-containing protein n=1 Tax=Deinococcus metallilatus TaxID=1211322 RepID=A0AAJ5K0P3_9DEIO|nr:MOSC domain-containing protein [Deinococcus metallilatus]MBB5294468.1 MOSC domain-containing protein YiiM [Deinococcus metallilatus]QBY07522.1 MOSC domain-containing protein [Deinococcus metallilatus]RXJ13938.1 MOSC domain-containing protein [Deinococcus metallilatus]TLK29903.1 MOSC domain-containing protein [Deinococcus metallilatus]GMA15684.1 molybdenum cofactor biosynthesis protein [Deinococcus metallilatus]